MLKKIVALFGSKRNARSNVASGRSQAESCTIRQGRVVQADKVFAAWTSGSLPAMLDVLDQPTNWIDRHFLLMNIVNLTYKDRDQQASRRKCRGVAELHLQEMTQILPALAREMGGTLPRISTFQQLATVLTEDGEYQRAIEVCQQAIECELSDGTKGGYAGRIERIRKKAR